MAEIQGSDLLADGSRLHTEAYLHLRGIVQQHISSGEEPILSESLKPIGGYAQVELQDGYFAELIRDNAEYYY